MLDTVHANNFGGDSGNLVQMWTRRFIFYQW